jgi:hydantoinase/carbamoylase family amidase
MQETYVSIDRERSARRIEDDVEKLGGPEHTRSSEAICRYAYTPEYRKTVEHFAEALRGLEFEVYEDPVGNLVARNRPRGEKVFGIGSHCDSNRNGGKYDGTLGVVTALEVCRLNAEHDLQLPLQLISFLEEESSGFGVGLLGSRIAAQRMTDEELRQIKAIDDGRPFWQHAEEAGYDPGRWRESIEIFEDLTGWIELHIEQARVLQDTDRRIGVVTGIAGLVWVDVTIEGRDDHAGATPMDFRLDAGVPAAQCVVELERLARAAGNGAVGTAGAFELDPGIVNVVPGRAQVVMDIRAPSDDVVESIAGGIEAFARNAAGERGMAATLGRRLRMPATPMDERIVRSLESAAERSGEPYMLMPSGAAHDTMCVADHVPTGMLFVPCKDGISHSPEEEADPADAAVAAELLVNAIRELSG